MNTKIVPIHQSNSQTITEMGIVKNLCDGYVLVQSGVGLVKAEVAFSCLITPAPEDRVLLAPTDQAWFVLAVLTRPSGRDLTLQFPGKVKFEAQAGDVEIETSGRLHLSSAKIVDLQAPVINAYSKSHQIVSKNLDLNAESLTADIRETKYFGKHAVVIVDQIVQRAQNVIRYVEGLETLNLGNLVKNIRQFMSIRSQHASITTRKDLKLDGERIHMG